MVGAGLFGLGQRVVFLLLGEFGFLFNFASGQADLGQQQGNWRAGKFFALGTEQPEVQQLDLLVLELKDSLKAGDFRLQVLKKLACGGG